MSDHALNYPTHGNLMQAGSVSHHQPLSACALVAGRVHLRLRSTLEKCIYRCMQCGGSGQVCKQAKCSVGATRKRTNVCCSVRYCASTSTAATTVSLWRFLPLPRGRRGNGGTRASGGGGRRGGGRRRRRARRRGAAAAASPWTTTISAPARSPSWTGTVSAQRQKKKKRSGWDHHQLGEEGERISEKHGKDSARAQRASVQGNSVRPEEIHVTCLDNKNLIRLTKHDIKDWL